MAGPVGQSRLRSVWILIFALMAVGSGITVSGYFRPMVVMSGSMEPVIPLYSLILVQTGWRDYAADEIIVFQPPDRQILVVHRVIELEFDHGETVYITMGDANRRPDRLPVAQAAIVGRVVAVIPYAGRVALALKYSPLLYLLLVPAALILLAALLYEAHDLLAGREAAKLEGQR